MITYKDIYEISRKERFSEGLQKIPENFIVEFSEYLKEKKKMASKEEDLFSDLITKTKKQIENSVILFKELLFHRRKKILDLILIASEVGIPKKDFNNMFDFEKKLFEGLMKEIEYSNKVVSHLLDGKQEGLAEVKSILIKEDIKEFLNFEGEKKGPFKKGQIIELPKKIAEILIRDEKAELYSKN